MAFPVRQIVGTKAIIELAQEETFTCSLSSCFLFYRTPLVKGCLQTGGLTWLLGVLSKNGWNTQISIKKDGGEFLIDERNWDNMKDRLKNEGDR